MLEEPADGPARVAIPRADAVEGGEVALVLVVAVVQVALAGPHPGSHRPFQPSGLAEERVPAAGPAFEDEIRLVEEDCVREEPGRGAERMRRCGSELLWAIVRHSDSMKSAEKHTCEKSRHARHSTTTIPCETTIQMNWLLIWRQDASPMSSLIVRSASIAVSFCTIE